MDEKLKEWYLKNNIDLPSVETHGSVRDKLEPLKPRNWRQAGNQLIADTDWGELVNPLPYGYILTGTDDKGLPTFKKL